MHLSTYFGHIALWDCANSASISRSFSAFWFIKKLVVTFSNDFQAFFSTSLSWSSNFTSSIHYVIWGPTHTPSLIFASIILADLFFKYINPVQFSATPWRNFYESKFDVQGRKVNFSVLINGVFTTFFCPVISDYRLGHCFWM